MSFKQAVHPSRLAVAIAASLAASHVSSAVITVDSLSDPGDPTECSLRSAIESVNTQAAVDACYAGDGVNDTVVFAPGLTGTITLDGNALDISADVIITGPGAAQLTVDAGQQNGGFEVSNYAQATLSGLTIENGSAAFGAGAYVNNGYLTLQDCVLRNNQASSNGGAIELFGGSLSVNACTFENNSADYNGGAIAVTRGSATVEGSTLSGNSAYVGGGAHVQSVDSLLGPGPQGAVRGASGNAYLLIIDSIITGNNAYLGGGLGAGYLESGGKLDPTGAGPSANLPSGQVPPPVPPNLVVIDSEITNNDAVNGGGIGAVVAAYQGPGPQGYPSSLNFIQVSGSEISSNEAYVGGGIGVTGGQLSIAESLISDNLAFYDGGGISMVGSGLLGPIPISLPGSGSAWTSQPGFRGEIGGYGDLSISGSIIDGNTADEGGGVLVRELAADFFATRISDNSGGGISVRQGAQRLFGSQISGNYLADTGGLFCDEYSICLVEYSSVTGNEGSEVGGINARNNGIGPVGQIGDAPLTIFSSTISSNQGILAGGVYGLAMTLQHSTVAFNQQISPRTRGLDGQAGGVAAGDATLVNHSVIANNSASSGSADIRGLGQGSLSIDYSLIGDSSGLNYAGSGNLVDVDPLLGPLDANGSSYSLTHALLSGSPAIEAGNPAIPSPPEFDQRGPGFDRIIGARIDMGAFEAAGAPVEPEVGLSTGSVDFSGILVGLDESAPLTITSTGTADLIIGSVGLAPAGLSVFGIANDDCSGQTLAPGSTCTLDITFQPLVRGTFNDELLIPSNAPDSPASVALAGVGVAPELAIAPAAINFGNVLLGGSANGSVVLSNSGDADLELTGSDVATPFARVAGAGLCLEGGSTTLAPTESCTLTFSFEPVAEGPASQTVNIASNSLGGDSTVALSGVGIISAPPVDPAVPVPVMGKVGNAILGLGVMLLGLLGIRRLMGS